MTNIIPAKTIYTQQNHGVTITQANLLTADWEHEMLLRGSAALSYEDIMFTQQTFGTWLNPAVLDRPAIVAAPPGFGKSTMLATFLRSMVRADPKFGAIVIKERVADLIELAKFINEETPGEPLTVIEPYAYYIRGNSDEITREDYEKQFTKQSQFNIVLMTTKQFELQVLKDNLHTFSAFREGREHNASKRPRRNLYIDEKPSLIVQYGITSRNVNEIIEALRYANTYANASLKRAYARITKAIIKLRDQFEAIEGHNAERLPAIDPSYILPRELLAQFVALYDVSKLGQLRAIEHLIKFGGLAYVNKGVSVLQGALKLHYDWTQYNTFVLDGSGRIDPDYHTDEFYLIEPPTRPDYSNVTFNVSSQFTLSKTAVRNDVTALSNIADECRLIAAKHEGQTLIVTYREFVDGLARELEAELTAGKIRLKHFDGGRGSNDYISFDTAIYIGNLNKGGLYYPASAQAIIGDAKGLILSPESVNTKAGLIFKDAIVESYKKLDMAVNLVQETNRLRANKKTAPVNLYVFTKDDEMLGHITDSYPGCKTVEYKTGEKLTGKKTAADNIKALLLELKPGDSIKQAEIYKRLEIARNTLHIFMTSPEATEFMAANNIRKEKTRIFKG